MILYSAINKIRTISEIYYFPQHAQEVGKYYHLCIIAGEIKLKRLNDLREVGL